MTERVTLIEERLRSALAPESLEIIDNSPAHARHAGASDGGGYFTVRIVSAAFAGKTLIQRHRIIHNVLAELMRREIHALSISKAQTPDEL